MGGNVTIDSVSADRIDLKAVGIPTFSKSIEDLLWGLRSKFLKKYGTHIFNWDFKKYLSGSTYSALSRVLPENLVLEYMPSIGDIDIQVNEEHSVEFTELLKSIRVCGEFIFIGSKRGNGQVVTLWAHMTTGLKVQIDFEFVPFEDGYPTAWAKFSHNSDIRDIKVGVKGVFHKFLLRALTAKTLKHRWVLYGKNLSMIRSGLCTLDAFSVTHGLRRKLKNTNAEGVVTDDSYEEIPISESTFITNPSDIFEYFFEEKPSSSELDKFYSFVGTLELIKKYYTPIEVERVKIGFCNTLWGSGAQQLDKNGFDLPLKMIALNQLELVLGEVEDQTAMIEKYYENRSK